MIIFGWKWLGKPGAHSIVISKKGLRKFDDRELLIKACKLFKQADAVVTHYGSVFDKKFIQGRLLINHLPPLPHPKMRDTCMAFRAVANFSSNRLKHIAKVLKFRHQKLENNWPTAWFQVMQGNRKVLNELAVYCEGDVLCLEEAYLAVSPFIKAWRAES